ncbi:MAG: nucleotidyl transferase AbiEii/AbiGii toxin family protein [Microgenomates group bacterium]
MDELTVKDLVKKLNTFPENIVREEYEMIFLKALMESPWGKCLVFKGGTALRLAYQSLRFSEDLDFALIKKIKWGELKKILEEVAKDLPTVKVKELTEKYYTYFGLFSIKEDYLPQPFLLKIEISKRPVKWKEGKDFQLLQLTSLVTPLKTSGFVVTRERIFADKKKAFRQRVKGRDLYDLWWLAQYFKKKPVLANGRFEKKKISAELKRFLPKGNWWLIEKILK